MIYCFLNGNDNITSPSCENGESRHRKNPNILLNVPFTMFWARTDPQGY